MKHPHAFAAAALAGLLASTSPAVATTLEQAASATVRLNGNCSAQVIYSQRDQVSGEVSTLVLTAKHCVGAAGKEGETHFIEIASVDAGLNEIGSRRYLADVKARSTSSDLAILRLRDLATLFPNTVELAPAKPAIAFGERVYTLGYPFGNTLTIVEGLLGMKERLGIQGAPEVPYQRATPNIAGGNSGGGLYHLKPGSTEYELLGVAAARRVSDAFYGLYVPAELVREFVAKAAPEVLK